MAYRSDRRGDVPMAGLALKGRAQSIGSPRATFHHGQSARRSFNGPEIRLQSTLAVLFDLAFPGGVQI